MRLMRLLRRRSGPTRPYFTMGEEHAGTGVRPASTDDQLYGEGWAARRTPVGCYLEWDAGQLMSEYVVAAISAADFERLRTEPDAFRDLAIAHEPQRVYPRELGAAIVGYLHWSDSAYPRHDVDAARAAARKGDPEVLLGHVEALDALAWSFSHGWK